jgi:transcription-repair coupling factor (superfamily II helicase)
MLRLLEDHDFPYIDSINFQIGRLNHGALFPGWGLAFVPHHRLFGRYRQRRVLRHAEDTRPVIDAGELIPGDYVVHVQHGIGKFRSLEVLDRKGYRREHLKIEFAEGMHIYVPGDRMELVHRYIGVGGRKPRLSKIHGRVWKRAKKKAEDAVEDLAAELLRLQAVRQSCPGISFRKKHEWEEQFEAEFPYEETEDQLRAIEAVKDDMASGRPMDRLICGDVGYGKTEIAMRAAFKCVTGGWQVAVLVPTTVLAQQHYRTFRERMADYPVRIEMLSRFVSRSDAQDIIEDMACGKVDIVIGTHRLLQDDVAFKRLGLIIIDEEQRFGVKDKERLKQMRMSVDVLTLTATPIPRTLHMSLMGLRDISSLQTPPISRQAVETRLSDFDPEVLRRAIRRELNREGQVFLVHNRVNSIEQVARMVEKLVPEATVEIGHGQMSEKKLAEVMERFANNEVDVLVSTTIIENGLDMPNANTIIINRAELLGLAEMHQLRGRVGRYLHKAYAYFFTPRDRPVTPEARRRLRAIMRYSDLGAGFDIALRDLEIRGAGNILGPEQSGHIAAVGYKLYCRLLTQAHARLHGKDAAQPPVTTVNVGFHALLPQDYVPGPGQRMALYRRISEATAVEHVESLRQELRDRFGELPDAAENLLMEAELRIRAGAVGIDSVSLRDGRIFLSIADRQRFENALPGNDDAPRMIDDGTAVLENRGRWNSAKSAALYLKRILS